MLTNNFKKILFKHIFGFSRIVSGVVPDSDDYYSDHPTLISISGSNCPIAIGTGSSAYVLRNVWHTTVNSLSTLDTTPTDGRGCIILGNGTNQGESPEDFRLESQITTNLSCDSVSVSRNTTIKTYTATFSNSGTSDITITEVGYVSRIMYTYANFNNIYDDFLMDRTVLDTPVTIPAGESRTVTYELSF